MTKREKSRDSSYFLIIARTRKAKLPRAEARAKNAGSARRSRRGRIAGQRSSDNRVLYRSGRGRKNRKSDFWRVFHNQKVVYRP